MHFQVHADIADITEPVWNRLIKDNNPFLRHEFLVGLEVSGCVRPETGWQPAHIAAYSGDSVDSVDSVDSGDNGDNGDGGDNGDERKAENSQLLGAQLLGAQLLGVMPAYVKHHSYGEYIFDWGWANAFESVQLPYYPKLCNAVPFTPATGSRFLCDPSQDSADMQHQLLSYAIEFAKTNNLSSVHSLFVDAKEYLQCTSLQVCKRLSSQFHWRNVGFASFDDFLAGMSSKKRKNIRRERKRVHAQGVRYEWLQGDDLNVVDMELMYQFYQRTVALHGGYAYLNVEFFRYLAEHFAAQTLLLKASYGDQVVAGGLYFKSDDTLYGRYWGALADFHSVHFETCYYQPIEWCIRHGFKRFEAGAQGEHKLSRGLTPVSTYSLHWIRDERMRAAIADFIISEQTQVTGYQEKMWQHAPFKQRVSDAR